MRLQELYEQCCALEQQIDDIYIRLQFVCKYDSSAVQRLEAELTTKIKTLFAIEDQYKLFE